MSQGRVSSLLRSVQRDQGIVAIADGAPGKLRVTLEPNDPALFIPMRVWETSLSLDVVEQVARQIDFPWVCDNLARLEDPDCVAAPLRRSLFAYFPPSAFAGRRILDFGCGSGASTIIMAEILPEAAVVGVELDPARVDLARRIAADKRVANVSFHVSPTPSSLPPEAADVDFIVLSAVYEHLLPRERRTLLPLLWSNLKPGGAIFINGTPFRWLPYEHHTTGLWLINYLPDFLACYLARRYSRLAPETNRNLDWEGLLRHGIRGGTEREALRNLRAGGGSPGVILQPRQNGLRDRADYWLSCTSPHRYRAVKRLIASAFRICDRTLGVIPGHSMDVVIGKPL